MHFNRFWHKNERSAIFVNADHRRFYVWSILHEPEMADKSYRFLFSFERSGVLGLSTVPSLSIQFINSEFLVFSLIFRIWCNSGLIKWMLMHAYVYVSRIPWKLKRIWTYKNYCQRKIRNETKQNVAPHFDSVQSKVQIKL